MAAHLISFTLRPHRTLFLDNQHQSKNGEPQAAHCILGTTFSQSGLRSDLDLRSPKREALMTLRFL